MLFIIFMKMKQEVRECCICGASVGNGTDRVYKFSDGNMYCKKHYLQMYRHGHIIERTIYDPNEYIEYEDYAECICYDKSGNEKGRVKIDLDKVSLLKKHKVYIRKQSDKIYAAISIDNKKVMLHRYLMKIINEEYSINKVVDHINGDSLDNRISNLRICTHKQNMQNIRKKNKIVGVSKSPNKNNRWIARIMHDYKTINLGYFDTYAEAALARIQKEKEICGECGPNKDLFYVLDLPSPLEELKKFVPEGV